MSHEPAPSAAPRTRSGFLAGMLGILSSGGRATGRAPSPLPLPPQPRLPPPSVALSVPAQSLSDEICAGITRSAQDATLSSTGRRMYSEVLLSLRDPDDPADPADPADQAQQNTRPTVRFEQRPAPQPQPPARTSSVAMDAITAAKRRAAAADAPSRGMAQSTPHSRAMSSDDSLADMLASADGSERFGGYRVPDLPGLESYGGTPVPANARLRRLEDEVLHGVSRPATAVLASFDAPPSDAGTGRTQILDFAEADVRAPAAQLQRRPSARPEIRDVRAILWADTNPTSTAAASADLKSASDPKIMSDPKVMSDPKSLVLAAAAPNGPAPDPKILSDSKVLSDPKILSDSKGLHDPLVLARLVHTSPDPRSLIYDAASQFGSMRSRPSLGSPKPEAEPKPEAKPMLEAPAHPDALSAHSASMPAPSSSHPSLGASAAVAAFEVPAPDELSMHRRSRQFAQVTDSEALAHASVQATMSGESPAIAAKTLAQQQPLRAYSHAQPSAASGKRGERPMSLQEYVEQQKLSVHHRATPTGHEQLNFRVSLLERTPPEYNRKSRSVSLPPPHSRLPALPFDILQPAIARPSLDRPVYIPRPAATHQRTKSFYDSPPLAQALLLPEWPKAAAVSGQSQKQSLADDELAERALFSHLLGDGAALTSPDLKVARRQSGAQPLVQTAPPLFDPEIDTGENGVPDSVLRAYLAGDLTAIERFFEHIMRITAPSSIYDGEVSEDGDWTFGLEGPPPEVLAEREAARKELANASREVPDMIDASAEASRVAASSTNLQQAPAVSEPMLASASSSSPAAQTPVIWPDLQTSASVVTPVDVRAMPLAELLPQPSPSPMAEEASAVHDDGGAVSSEAPASNGASNASKPVRRIAVAKSQLARKKREGLHNNSGQSSSTNSADLSGHNCKSNTSASLTNSQRPPDDESCPQPNDEPTSPWDDIDISAAPNQTASVRDIDCFAAPTISHPPSVEAEAHLQYDKVAACISPGRARSRNRRQSESGARSTIIPSQDLPSGKRQERQILMARLRVLEAMIQKAAIEESRLQPPAVLRKSRLVEDVESIASIYSSSMEMGYERIYQELNNSQRPRADSRRKSADPGALRHSGESARQQQGLADGQARNLGPGQTPHATARGEVLARLKQGSQARAMSPLRASVLGRPHLAPAYRPGERSAGANTGGVANASLLLSDMSEVAYSARSGGSIRIDIVNEGSAPSLSATDTSHFGRTPDYQSSSRFRRTAKLLGL
ncbi:hypothetical protein IWW47_001311 [Coemansia sp. RSA 2052]|nr:hypothetical protein IWW47_001311 [Coemansia sp. RSA 2052]